MPYLPRFRNVPNRQNIKNFFRELYFVSYIVCNTISLKQRRKCGITAFTKMCTNYVEDWYEIIKVDYKPCADIKANPYGMVSTIAAPAYEAKDAEIYVYNLQPYAENKGLWKIIERGGSKEVHTLMEADEIKEILEHNEDEILRTFNPIELGLAEALSGAYQYFSPTELNILCSHRDVNKSETCLKYTFRSWSTEFQRVIGLLKNNGPENDIVKSIGRIARSCEQVEVKTRFVWNGLPRLIEKIKDIEVAGDIEKPVKDVLKAIHKRMVTEKRAPIFDDNYIINLQGQYRLNKERIYPLTTALINYYKDRYGKSRDLTTFDLIGKMNGNINSMEDVLERESIIETGTKNEIESDIRIIEKEYDNLCKIESNLLKPFKSKKRVDWDICNDGREETW